MLAVSSIQFKTPALGRRAIVVTLNNGHNYRIFKVRDVIKTRPAYNDDEKGLLALVYAAAWGFLNGDEPGTLDGEALVACSELAGRFDWDGAGYAAEYDADLEAEQINEMTYRIAHYMNI